MATVVIMPRQGQSVESCIITAFNKKVGDAVEAGEILFSYETDKSSFEEPAPVAGKILAIFPQGHRYPGINPAESPTKNGAALLAYRSGSNIVPVCIKVKGFKYHFLGKVEIIFGKPIKNSELGFVNGGSEEYKAATDKIFAEIINLGGYAALPSPKTEEGENT